MEALDAQDEHVTDDDIVLGDPIVAVNNYWNDRTTIHPLNLPRLPHIEMGYGGVMYARRSQNYMNKAVPETMESIAMDSESGVAIQSEDSNHKTEDEVQKWQLELVTSKMKSWRKRAKS